MRITDAWLHRSHKIFLAALTILVTAGDAQNGWTDLTQFLVPSSGSRSLGSGEGFNTTRDTGSKIIFFNRADGDNVTGHVYWWDGSRIVDMAGSPTDSGGREYGTDPLQPNESAIRPLRYPVGIRGNAAGDVRIRTHNYAHYPVAESYPDWFLFRRGQTHDTFDGSVDGGRSEQQPMVVAAYGPLADGRATINAATESQVDFRGELRTISEPFCSNTHGDSAVWFHMVMWGLQLHHTISYLGTHDTPSLSRGVPSLLIEDCRLINASMYYMPIRTAVHRCISAFRWSPDSHNHAYYNAGFDAACTFDEVIMYRNGYKTDPMTDPDPRRDIFSRNIYQGGGARMGHTYRNIVSADGASGGPQMRLGGLCENSLIIEGYWYSSTASNSAVNPWLTAGQQTGRSAVVRDNVQFVLSYPNASDPDTDTASDRRAQPGWGYALQGASFGSMIENNIVSLAMLADDLGDNDTSRAAGYTFNAGYAQYQDGNWYNQKNDTIRGNIAYRTQTGLSLQSDWTGVTGHVAENNVFACGGAVDDKSNNLAGAAQLNVRNNRFYTGGALPSAAWIGAGNTISPYAQAAQSEGWSDPDRTLKRYVTEVLNLTRLDWADDPWLDPAAVAVRTGAGEEYDPMGLKTFMAVATNMRNGGATPVPSSGKPSWTGDYPWDTRYTAIAVVNWVREGFGMSTIVNTRPVTARAVNGTGNLALSIRPAGTGRIGIAFTAETGTRISATIHDLQGRVVRNLGTRRADDGVVNIVWNGLDNRGVKSASRLLVVSGVTDQGVKTAKAVVFAW
jgi:hypothetical protein